MANQRQIKIIKKAVAGNVPLTDAIQQVESASPNVERLTSNPNWREIVEIECERIRTRNRTANKRDALRVLGGDNE